MIFVALAATALAAQTTAPADTVVLSGSYGRPMTVGQAEDAREKWAPTAMNTSSLFGAFKSVCVDGAIEAAGLTSADVSLPADRKTPAVVVPTLGSQGVQIVKWNGDAATLKGRASVVRDRGVSITGPVSNRNLPQPQCGLSARTSSLDAVGLGTMLTQAFGPSTKLVVKDGFADGSWQVALPDGRKAAVAFYAVDLKKPAQLLHISLIEEKNAK